MAGICSHLEFVLSRLLGIFVHSSRTHNGFLKGVAIEWIILSRILSNASIDQSSCKQREVLVEKQWWWLWLAVFKAALLGCIIMHNTILCLRSVLSCISLANQVWNCKQEVYLGFPALPQTEFFKSLSRYEMWEGMETHDLAQSRVWCVLCCWQLQCCCCCCYCCCIGPPLLMIHAASPTNPL